VNGISFQRWKAFQDILDFFYDRGRFDNGAGIDVLLPEVNGNLFAVPAIILDFGNNG